MHEPSTCDVNTLRACAPQWTLRQHLGEHLCVESPAETSLLNHVSDSGDRPVRIHGPVHSSSGRPTVAPSMATRTDEGSRKGGNAEPSVSGKTTAEVLRHRLPKVASNSQPAHRRDDRRREPLDDEHVVSAKAGHGIVMSDPERSQRRPDPVV
jgi:hypothetical protein